MDFNSNFNVNKFGNRNFQNINNSGINKNAPNSSISNSNFANQLNLANSLNRITQYSYRNNVGFFYGEKSIYMKELMNLPKEMKDLLALLQQTTTQNTAGKELSKLLSSNINLASLAELMQKNGKEAISKLVTAMTEMSKQGVETSTLKDTMKLINASISVSGQESQTQAVKTLMLLYLPWLPLHEGKDFELEIDLSENSVSGDDAIMNILIATVNYGNINISIITKAKGSFDVLIKCVKDFPQKELKEKMQEDNKKYSIKAELIFEELKEKGEEKKNHQVKVTMTNLKDVCGYLLSLSNDLIRNTILIDKTPMNDFPDKQISTN